MDGGAILEVEVAVSVKVDRQGRVVLPRRERERLGVGEGGSLELVPTPEGLLLERRRTAQVADDDTGVPVITISGGGTISNDGTLGAIREHRDRR
ncbi:MAG: AbrB/MazE/SpoVT family DNA-binding domain-containing protein [Nitriliruptoraceae bacterium]